MVESRSRAPDDAPTPALPPVDPTAAGRALGEAITPELLAGLLADGDDELAAWALSEALRDAPRTQVYDGLLAAAMGCGDGLRRWASSASAGQAASRRSLRNTSRARPCCVPWIASARTWDRRVGSGRWPCWPGSPASITSLADAARFAEGVLSGLSVGDTGTRSR